MPKTLIALYENIPTAEKVLRDLQMNGFDPGTMSILAHDSADFADPHREVSTTEGRNFGAVVGGIAGLLVGLVTITLPGVGPIITAGPLAALLGGATGTMIGAGAGALTGSLSTALANINVPERDAQRFIERMLEGNVLVTVEVNANTVEDAIKIMSVYLPVDIQYRVDKLPIQEKGDEADPDDTIDLNRNVKNRSRLVREYDGEKAKSR